MPRIRTKHLTDVTLSEYLSKWSGDNAPMVVYGHDHELCTFTLNELRNNSVILSHDNAAYMRLHLVNNQRNAASDVLSAFSPKREPKGMISIWQDAKAREQGDAKRSKMKPGRAFRKMFPGIADSALERIVDAFRARYDDSKLTLRSGTDAESFIAAYSGAQAPMQNPNIYGDRKSLANSCMRHAFDNLPTHPAAAYASGDFAIYYAVDESELIAARVVVMIAKNGKPLETPKFGPCYGVSEAALDLLERAMKSIGAELADDDDWIGARLVAIEFKGGYVAPYLDVEPRNLLECGETLRISTRGDIDASDYSGLLNSSAHICCSCGERLNQYETRTSDDGEDYCEGCFCEAFDYCDRCDCYVSNGEMREVYRSGDDDPDYMCRCCTGQHATRCTDNRYWFDDVVQHAANGDAVSPQQMDDGDYFISEGDGEIYPRSEMVTTDEGDTLSIGEVKDSDQWELDENGAWRATQLELELEE